MTADPERTIGELASSTNLRDQPVDTTDGRAADETETTGVRHRGRQLRRRVAAAHRRVEDRMLDPEEVTQPGVQRHEDSRSKLPITDSRSRRYRRDRWVPFDVEQTSGEGLRDPRRVILRLFRHRAAPAVVDTFDEQLIPTIEELRTERRDIVHLLMRTEHEPVVAGLAEQHSAPEVDELRDVIRPIDFGHLDEHGCEQIVEHDLSVEAHDEVVNLGRANRGRVSSEPFLFFLAVARTIARDPSKRSGKRSSGVVRNR